MNDLRVKFEKTGRAAYISHLDLMRTFQRVFIRSGIALKHSEGFNPHPRISVILPLPLGCRGFGEFMDIETKSVVEPTALIAGINEFMPEGIRALDAAHPVMKPGQIKYARWVIELLYDETGARNHAERIKELFSKESLLISRKTKRGVSEFDLKPYTENLSVSAEDRNICIKGILSAQEPSVSPALVMNAIRKYLPDCAAFTGVCSRISLYDGAMSDFY